MKNACCMHSMTLWIDVDVIVYVFIYLFYFEICNLNAAYMSFLFLAIYL